MAKKLHWLVVNHLFWSDFEQLDWCLWKQLICTKFQQFWGNWPSSFAPYSHIFMMIPNIMGHLPLTEHIKAFSICFQLLGQQFDFSVFCSNSLAYGIVWGHVINLHGFQNYWQKISILIDIETEWSISMGQYWHWGCKTLEFEFWKLLTFASKLCNCSCLIQ